MRIACCIHGLDGGGAERLMAGLANRLVESHAVTLITWAPAGTDRYPIDPRIERVGLSLRGESHHALQGIWRSGQRIAALRSAIAKSGAEVALSFCDQMNVLACLATPVPIVVSEHTDPMHQPLSASWRIGRKIAYRRAAAGIALTDQTRRWMQAWMPHRPIAVIPPAIDAPPTGWPSLDREPGPPWRLIAMGRLSPEKGIDRLIDAFARSNGPATGWVLDLIGDGPLRQELQSLANSLRCANSIHFVGWRSNVWAELASAHALALSSHYEGFPLALLEGMAAGLPCISVDCPSGPRELIRSGHNGLLVESSNEGLLCGLNQLFGDPQLRIRLGREAVAVRETYTWQRFLTAHEDLLRQVVNAWHRKD
jgi:glycosyltransferase involved in cell wall biosynthesis